MLGLHAADGPCLATPPAPSLHGTIRVADVGAKSAALRPPPALPGGLRARPQAAPVARTHWVRFLPALLLLAGEQHPAKSHASFLVIYCPELP